MFRLNLYYPQHDKAERCCTMYINSAKKIHLFVDPALAGGRPRHDFGVVEPEGDLLVGGLYRIGAVQDVASDLDAQITPDGAGGRFGGVGGAEHDASGADGVEPLPHHGDYGARAHVLDQPWEEGPGGQVGVVLLQQLLARPHEFEGDELEALLLEALDDLADDAALDAVRLDHDEGPFAVRHGARDQEEQQRKTTDHAPGMAPSDAGSDAPR